MAVDLDRRTFVAGSAALGAGWRSAGRSRPTPRGRRTRRNGPKAAGYGPLQPTPEEDSGIGYLELPVGLPLPADQPQRRADAQRAADARDLRRDGRLRRPGQPDRADPQPREPLAARRDHRAGARRQALRPGRQRPRRQHQARRRPDRRLQEVFPVLGGTHTNCAGGLTPWGTWITCEEIFNYGSVESNVTPGTGVPHGFAFEVPADANGPVTPQPILDAGRFSHEAVAWHGDSLYETEDRGDACLYRFTPERRPKEAGDLATFGGVLQALGRPRPAELRRQPRRSGRDLQRRMGQRRRAEPGRRHRPRAGPGQGRGDLRPHRGHLDRRQPPVLRLHDRRRGPARPALGAAPARARRRRAEADLRIDERRGPREPGQPRRRARDRRRLPAGGLRRRAVRARRHRRAA